MRKKTLLLVVVCILACGMAAMAQAVEFDYPQAPSISRFQGFSGVIPRALASRLQLSTVRVYVNGEDETTGLKIEQDSDSGGWIVSFLPPGPLSVGRINVRFMGYAEDGTLVSQTFSYVVDPASDPDLRSAVKALEEDPTSSEAHFRLGELYEQKRLFQDAAYEYNRAAFFDPRNADARKAYDRIFAMWGEKSLSRSHVTVNVALDDSLLSLGGPVTFEVRITNESAYPVQVDPRKSVFVDSQGNQVPPLEDLDAYVEDEADSDLVTMDQYAQLSYFMDTHTFALLGPTTLHSSTVTFGYLAFPKPAGGAHAFTLIVSGVTENGDELSFRFPFLLP